MLSKFFYPRAEYPRPDRQRGTVEGYDWLNLNGPWQFRFDPDRKGLEEKWFVPSEQEWREQIIVPFCWESLAAWGEGDAAGNDNYYSTRVFRNPLEVTRANHRSAARYEVGWHRREVRIPDTEPWHGKRIILTIGAADFFTDCWCNGVPLGHHEGGYTPFEFDLTDVLGEKREGVLVLRVEDPMDNSEQPVGKQWRWYTTTSGIWQTVFVEPRNQTHIRFFRITTDIDDGTATFDFACAKASKGCGIQVVISDPDKDNNGAGVVAVETAEVTNDAARLVTKIPEPRLWEHNSPNLYHVLLTLRRGNEVVDTIRSYFGMRKIDFEIAKESGVPAALRVNGLPRYLRGALYQSYHPDGVYTATSVETLKNDIAAAKKYGFNFLRVHIKVDDPLLLYWADKLGMLLMADFPNFGEGGDTPLGRQRFETMMREAIERDFNHPSIFAWCLFNETWGFGGQDTFADILHAPATAQKPAPIEKPNPGSSARAKATSSSPSFPRAQVWVQRMWELAKQLDPTRLVEDMSVCHWEHLDYYLHCDTDINSWHFYINDYEKAKAHIDKIVSSTFIGSSFNYVPGFLHKGQPLINSEYGGIGALDGDRDVSWSFKFLTNELRRHQQISAYIYTELHDVEWEYNGFLNYDRTPKEFGYDPRIINESNTLPLDSAPILRLPPGASVRLKVYSSHYSTRKYDDVSLHWYLGGLDSQGRIHRDLVRGVAPISFPHRRAVLAREISFTLPQTPMLCNLILGARSKDGETLAQNFVHYFAAASYPPEREETARRLILRAFPWNWHQAEWSGGCGEREHDRAEDACHGFGNGFFEWTLPISIQELARARGLKIICEASSHRTDAPQTDEDILPTTLQVSVNDVILYHATLRNHPHDSRGVLSYLRGGVGGYGYLVHAFAENELLQNVAQNQASEGLRLRLAVPPDASAQNGLTVYGAECGRFPVTPMVILEY